MLQKMFKHTYEKSNLYTVSTMTTEVQYQEMEKDESSVC